MSTIFNTGRLQIRSLSLGDLDLFYEMMSDSRVTDPIPQPVLSKSESVEKLNQLIETEPFGEKMVWAITTLNNDDLIGICGFLINTDGNPEIAYRFRPEFWGKGYGTEVALNLLIYGFKVLEYTIIDGDAYSENEKSIKILGKFMTLVDEFWNEKDQCFDKRYRITKKAFMDAN